MDTYFPLVLLKCSDSDTRQTHWKKTKLNIATIIQRYNTKMIFNEIFNGSQTENKHIFLTSNIKL